MVALKAHEVERAISKPNTNNRVILLYGPDSGLISERANQLSNNTGVDQNDPFSTIRLNAESVAEDKSRLTDEAYTIGMFGGERLIRISGSTRKNILDAFKPLLTDPPSDAWIIFESGDLNNKSALRSAFEKSKSALALPCYQDSQKALEQLIHDEITSAGIKISGETIVILKQFLGGDRMASRNELKKLALYAMDESEITPAQIQEIIGDASSFESSDVIDAVTNGDLKGFEVNFERVIDHGLSPDMLLIQTLRHYQLLHELRSKVESVNTSIKAIVDSHRPQIFYQRRPIVSAALARLKTNSIEKALKRLQGASFEARANPEIGRSIAGTNLLALTLEAKFAKN